MTPEFSRPLALANVPAEGMELRLEADGAVREAVAQRLGLLALHSLVGELSLRPVMEGCIAVRGRLLAELEQACVVTLEPVPQRVEEDFAWRLLPAGMEPSDGDDDPDDIETEAGIADLGEALVQQLSLALDPYPRAPGAELPEKYRADDASGPFGALRKLRPEG
jgi:hypothetical protein